jgi:hypothetical protein
MDCSAVNHFMPASEQRSITEAALERRPPARLSPQSASRGRSPLHEKVHAVRIDVHEPKAQIKAERRVVSLDVNGDRLAGACAARKDVVEEHRADSRTAPFGHERDVDEADLILPLVDPETADGRAVFLDDVALAGRIVKLVVLAYCAPNCWSRNFLLKCRRETVSSPPRVEPGGHAKGQ